MEGEIRNIGLNSKETAKSIHNGGGGERMGEIRKAALEGIRMNLERIWKELERIWKESGKNWKELERIWK